VDVRFFAYNKNPDNNNSATLHDSSSPILGHKTHLSQKRSVISKSALDNPAPRMSPPQRQWKEHTALNMFWEQVQDTATPTYQYTGKEWPLEDSLVFWMGVDDCRVSQITS
jgi:hypothetical protein